MKKITSLLALLLMFVVSTTAKADSWAVDDGADGLIQDASQITTPYNEPSEGSIAALLDGDASTFWHSKWSGGSVSAGIHYFQVEDIEGMPEWFGFTFTRRNAADDQITKWGVYGVPEGKKSADKTECVKLAIIETPFSSQTETLVSSAIQSKGYTTIRFYAEATSSERGYWHCAEFQILPCKQISDYESALLELQTILSQYGEYEFTAGTAPGQYGAEQVAAYDAAVSAAHDMDGSTDADAIKAAGEAVKATFEAVVASRIPFAMEIKPGYYVIKSALDFTKSTTTEETEDPDTGEIIPGETIVQHFAKAIYDNNGTASWKTFEENAAFLFKIEASDKARQYKVTNMHNGLTFNPISTSTAVTMSATDSLMVFDWALDDVTVYPDGVNEKTVTALNIRLAAQAERGSVYAHADGHGGGAGTSGNIVGWSHSVSEDAPAACATDWYLEEIDEATALAWIDADSPTKVIAKMIDEVNAIKTAYAEQKTIAEDKTTDLDLDSPVITSASQFSSPYTTIDSQSATEDEIFENLLNEEGTTYWHSAWESGSVAQDVHYLQVKDVELDGTYTVQITRRPVSGDQITKLRVKGYAENNEELGFEDGADLGLLLLPCSAADETLAATTLFTCTKDYSVLRFYSEEEVAASSGGGSNRGYWHCKKFQIYPAVVGYGATTTQATARATEMSALEAAIAAWNEGAYTTTSVTNPSDAAFVAAYNAVVKANNAWLAVYADPAAMREAINAVGDVAKAIKIGNNPGEWAAGSSADKLVKLLEDAKAYNNAGTYTEAGLQANIDAITNAKADIYGSANKVQTGKWYKFRMPTEAECEANGWDKICEAVMDGEVEVSPAIYGYYASTAKRTVQNDAYVFEGIEAENLTIGSVLYWLPDGEPMEDGDKFQFINVGDTAYMVQNKATGLFLKAGNSGAITLSPMPSLFKQSALGFGANLMESVQFETKYQHRYMHGQRDGGVVCTWEANTPGSRSSIFIEEAGDVKDFVAPDFYYNVYNGRTYAFCYPVDIELTDDDANLYGVNVEGTKVTLLPVKDNKVKAGTPFILVSNLWEGDSEYILEAEDEGVEGRYRNVSFAMTDTKLNTTPGTLGALVGNYYGGTTGKGDLVTRENGFRIVASESGESVGANQAYIKAGIEEGEEGWPSLTVEISGSTIDADQIAAVLSNVAKGGKIYTIDGKYVGNGNVNTLKGMAPGIYVINGVKVAVK